MQLKLSDRIMKPDFQGEFTASILAAAASPDIISFAGGLPNPVSFPIPEMEAATKKVLEENKFVNNVVIIGVADHLAVEIRKEIASHPADARNDNGAESNDKITFIRESEIAREALTSTSFVFRLKELRSVLSSNIYLSIDKDALSPAHAATNWDQGSLDVATLKEIIAGLATSHKIIGVDICGERARDFAGDEHHTVQEADALNDRINRELAEFLQNL